MNGRWLAGATFAAMAVTAVPAEAVTARELLDKAKAVNDAREPKDASQKMKMTLVDARGNERVREIESRAKTLGEDERKSIIFFLAPAEVKGVGFLSFSYPDRDDDQWLYLPALKRVRRITATTRTQSFQGSDFTYQDLDLFDDIPDWTEDDATSELVKEKETIDGVETAVIALAPKGKDIAYRKIVIWLAPSDSMLRKIELYDVKDGALVKTLGLSKIETISGMPTPHRMEMANVKKGSKTVMEISEVRYNQSLADELFTERALERGKAE
jgi:outer membrane lipoprotein-sorting protein